MFATIRRHQTWLWALIIGVVIVSFVIFFSPNAQYDFGLGGGNVGTVFGKPVSVEQFQSARDEAELNYFFNSGGVWPSADSAQYGWDRDQMTLQRLLLGRLLEKNDVEVDSSIAANWVARVLRNPQDDSFDPRYYQAFIQRQLQPKGITEKVFENYAKKQIGAQHLVSVFGLSGRLIPPREAEAIYRRENEEVESKCVFFGATNYQDEVVVTPDALEQYYSNRLSVYRIPEGVQVKYVAFAATNYLDEASNRLAEVTNLNQKIDAVYTQRGEDYYTDSDGNVLPEEEAKEKVKEEMLSSSAMEIAFRKANEFGVELFNIEPMEAENLNMLAQSNNLTVGITEPFSRSDGPKELEDNQKIIDQAFRLSELEPFAAPIRGNEAMYLLAFHKKLPARFPEFDEVRAEVQEDYINDQSLRIARKMAQTFRDSLTNALAQGKTFEEVCEEQGEEIIDIPTFSRSTRSLPELPDFLSVYSIKPIAFDLEPGEISRVNPTREGAFIMKLVARNPVSEEQLKEKLPAFMESLRQEWAYQAFNQWIAQQYNMANISGSIAPKDTSGAGRAAP
ncbi:MAG: SurA N-terminal domain-containing protein [Verrucomicrobia bacterium]|nr:SurA N-terminal domain-containing protein [Verrucomicrobiota bacterium]